MLTIQGRNLIRVVSVTALALSCSIVAHAQATLTGKWQGETNNGAAIVLDLTVKGTDLTGTLTRNGVSTPLSEGKVSKNTFTFKAKPGEVEEAFSGELSNDQIKVWLDRQGASTAIVLKRMKSA